MDRKIQTIEDNHQIKQVRELYQEVRKTKNMKRQCTNMQEIELKCSGELSRNTEQMGRLFEEVLNGDKNEKFFCEYKMESNDGDEKISILF